MKNTILFSLIFMTLLGNGVFSKASSQEVKEILPLDIKVTTEFAESLTIPKNANVTIRTVDPAVDPETISHDLDVNGICEFGFFYDTSGIEIDGGTFA
jgi:hypothetical protein